MRIKQLARKSTGGRAPRRLPKKRSSNRSTSLRPLEPYAERRNRPRFRPGEKALQEIRHFQRSTERLIPFSAFSRVVREIAFDQSFRGKIFRWKPNAIQALQEASEAFVVQILQDSNLCAIHGKRVTVMPRDMHLALRLSLKDRATYGLI